MRIEELDHELVWITIFFRSKSTMGVVLRVKARSVTSFFGTIF
jgi:hypothetical protein